MKLKFNPANDKTPKAEKLAENSDYVPFLSPDTSKKDETLLVELAEGTNKEKKKMKSPKGETNLQKKKIERKNFNSKQEKNGNRCFRLLFRCLCEIIMGTVLKKGTYSINYKK